MTCIKTSQPIARQPIADAEAPAFAHGDTLERPIPVPNARSASESAAATNAPATTAPQDTPDDCDSFLTVDTSIYQPILFASARANMGSHKEWQRQSAGQAWT